MELPAVRRVIGIAAPLVLVACAQATPPKVPFGDSCRKLFAEVDAKIDAAGVRDGGYYRVDGFPYLRADRFSASFRDEVGSNEDKFRAWTENMRQNDVDAREAELANLGMTRQQRADTVLNLRSCSAWLVHDELENAAWRKHLHDSVSPPDEYSSLARVAGLYPLAVPLFRMSLHSEQERLSRDYARPLASLDAPGAMLLWRAHRTVDPTEVPASLENGEHDGLGRAGMYLTAWRALVEAYAPNLWIETAGPYDRPGVPTLGTRHPAVDTKRPTVYYLETFTRVHGQLLVQLVYFTWFSERPALGADNAHAGALDGMIWRVTLDQHVQPLLYESIGAGGDHHYLFPVQGLRRRADADAADQSVFFPQDQVPGGAVSVRLRSGIHDVRRVVPLEVSQSAEVGSYELRPYEDLLTLPTPTGGTRSLFRTDGVVAGSQRPARWWLWPSGVADAGAMRQWARLPTTLVGRAEFDDPRYLEKLFVDLPSDAPMSADASPAGRATAGGMH
ncbi:MAG: hypothetical protein ISP90_00690 [Nevskia sp.]|nr:hypothetical protein [Nevskia sp.]